MAQATLGYLYYVGEGIEQDLVTAVDLYRRAADQGNPDAQYNLAVAYAFGEGVAQNFSIAVQWYTLAAEQEHAIAQYSLGLSYANGEGITQTPETAAYWFTRAADNGYARAQVLLGTKYHTGDGVPLDLDEAVRWYRMAADQQDPIAQFNLASMYRSGNGVDQDIHEAQNLYQLAAARGYNAAEEELAITQAMLEGTVDAARADATDSNPVVPNNETYGLMAMDDLNPSLPEKAIIDDEETPSPLSDDSDHESSERSLTATDEPPVAEARGSFFSRLFSGGDDKTVEADEADGAAPEMASEPAAETTEAIPDEKQTNQPGFLGRLLGRDEDSSSENAETVTQGNVTTSAKPNSMISEPAKTEIAEIDFNSLSGLYQAGMEQLDQQDYIGAVSLFRSAAARGEPMAQYQLGALYHQGLGLGMDHEQAALWYRRAAEQGNVDAQFSLGNMYLMGEDILQNDSNARYWYEQAASQGHTDAAHNLNNMEQFTALDRAENVIIPLQENEFSRTTGGMGSGREQDQAVITSTPGGSASSIAEVDYERGLAYYFGKGVAPDQSRAIDYFRRAAEKNHSGAQYKLGITYAYGDSTAQDKAQAAEWYRKAAMQGHSIAQRNLAIMYQDGDGIPENKSLALAWLSILADNGNVMDQRRRDMLAVELNSAQLDTAKTLKSELLGQIHPVQD